MKRFTGIAVIAFAAHSGLAWAQPAIVGQSDEMPRSRAERPAQGDMAPRSSGSDRGAPQQRLDESSGERRGAQIEQPRGPEAPRGQMPRREREQVQREQPTPPADPRAQQELRRGQPEERGQAQRQNERNDRRDTDRAQPNTRGPGSPETAQPQRPDRRPTDPNTARPAPTQDPNTARRAPTQDPNTARPAPTQDPNTARPAPTRQDEERPGTAQRPSPAQPGTAGPSPAENRASPGSQSAERSRADSDSQRIADTVRERVERNEIRPVQNLGISVSVGAALPSRVQLQPLPRDIAAIRPQYRDYRYTVSDREIIIVDPRSRRIVEVIDRGGGRAGTVDIYAAFETRRDVRRWRRPAEIVFQQGVILPASAPYYDLPVELVEDNPNWRGYQYVMTESDEVAIVEPRTHRIVEVVDKSGSRSASAAPQTTGALSSQARASGDRHDLARIILGNAKPGEIQGIDGLRGAVLPSQIVLHPLPPEVEERDQRLRGYHYTLIGDDVLIVEPQSRQVVDTIE